MVDTCSILSFSFAKVQIDILDMVPSPNSRNSGVYECSNLRLLASSNTNHSTDDNDISHLRVQK